MINTQKETTTISLLLTIYNFYLGKGINIWDYQTHNESHLIVDRSTGDIACDSYHMYEKDIELLNDLGVSRYCNQDEIFIH
jgi:DNA-directed RNA polymerase subunit N (RpoN/RPB10)